MNMYIFLDEKVLVYIVELLLEEEFIISKKVTRQFFRIQN